MKTKSTVSIIGLGSFGCFIATLLPRSMRVIGYDQNTTCHIPKNITRTSFHEAAGADIVILAVPLAAMPQVLQKLQSIIKPSALVVEVCSVKVVPEQLFSTYLRHHPNVLLTHPLFGPQSAAASTRGHELIVTLSRGHLAAQALRYCEKTLGLHIRHQSSDEHDRTMAQVHALTFFVGRALHKLNLKNVPFHTPSYDTIRALIALDASHSEDLFTTVQLGNPYAATMRDKLIQEFTSMNAELAHQEPIVRQKQKNGVQKG